MRINKYIAKTGFCSRRKADRLIEAGRVTLNGKTAKLGDDVEKNDTVKIDGNKVTTEGKEDLYIAFHKPVGVISTFNPDADNALRDWIDVGERVFYVGRLDVNSSGLMLFTNNGDIANKIAHAKGNVEKEYVVRVDKPISRKDLDRMAKGVMMQGRKTKPARVKRLGKNRFNIVLTEGRNRQIRRMCEKLGYEVKKIKRLRIANVKLGSLGAGNWRHLTKKERRGLIGITKNK